MKEFLKSQRVTYNLMSFTGFKSLVLFALLIESPKSYKEIGDYMINQPYLRENISVDTLRVYLNSLKRIGCEIKRIKEGSISKYSIVSNPFELNVTAKQTDSIAKIYKTLAKTLDIHELLLAEKFIKKISSYIKNPYFAEKVLILRDPEFVSRLAECAGRQIIIEYNSPNSGLKLIEILVDKVGYANNKLYLYGTSLEHKQYGSFSADRIQDVKEIKSRKTIRTDAEVITVGFELACEPDSADLDAQTKVLGVENNKTLIEITSSNHFDIMQRLLSFGPDCKILYPQSFRQEFVSILQEMKTGYRIG
ncbi:MAG: WYL domain-containing protein [Heliobacteriaceae bacterium]|nr:WYL domain-containing protein [Heliobacteriaceae bacterium]